jgi:hypothetical protein|tara:strand:+ start:379 stop:822 length:444 start_codon:yes stop_codon:yes gene_type:complete
MKDLKIIFRNLQSKLEQSSWFADGWEIYNRGVYLQLYKDTWYNDSQGGVHFETYIEAPQLRQKAFPICMHAEEDCPSQQIFIRDFLDSDGEKIRSWKGYDVMGDGYSICQRVLPLNFKNLEHRLYEEFNRLRQLESGIDRILRTLQQ